MIIGPCSADNEDSVCEYVSRLAKVNEKVKDRLMLIPRIYTNKPRTTGEGYKGMLHQPDPDKAPDLYAGIMAIRKMHIRAMKESGLTAADEMLYPENRSYLDDILSYEAVGARSVENQQHRLTDGKYGYSGWNEKSDQWRSFCNAQLDRSSTDGTPVHLQNDGCNDIRQSFAHTILRGGVDKYGQCIPNYHYEECVRLWELYQKKILRIRQQ